MLTNQAKPGSAPATMPTAESLTAELKKAGLLKEGVESQVAALLTEKLTALQTGIADKAKLASGIDDGEAAGGADENPLLTKLKAQYEKLYGTMPEYPWAEVSAKLTPEALRSAENLENAKIYGIHKGNLLIGDGGSEVPEETLKQNYPTARSTAQSKGLGLMTEAEYKTFNTGIFEVNRTWTWLESGDNPAPALAGYWFGGVDVYEDVAQDRSPALGARRVPRVYMLFLCTLGGFYPTTEHSADFGKMRL